ncbi:MAG TPA: hypothetical protein VKS43_14130 [Burkholderiales bacterium]|nr:hypothetical protein [Burkholderiales bacterium]
MSDHPIVFVAVAMLFAAMAAAADPSDSSSASGRDPAVREAQAAKQEEQQGRLKNDADRDQREQNKYARCDYLQGDDREYCIRRMNGEGTVSGSVESGGITRELRVPVPAR